MLVQTITTEGTITVWVNMEYPCNLMGKLDATPSSYDKVALVYGVGNFFKK